MLSPAHFLPECLWWRRWGSSSQDAGMTFLPTDTQGAQPAMSFFLSLLSMLQGAFPRIPGKESLTSALRGKKGIH